MRTTGIRPGPWPGGGEDDWDQAGGGAGQIGEDGEAAGGGGGQCAGQVQGPPHEVSAPHDSSMLYPQEHRSTRTLRYACRLCRYSEESPGSSCGLIYRNSLTRELGNVLATVPAAVADDPTLPRSQNASCMNCGHHEAVFFQSDTSDVRSDSLALIFVCCNCGHKWVT